MNLIHLKNMHNLIVKFLIRDTPKIYKSLCVSKQLF